MSKQKRCSARAHSAEGTWTDKHDQVRDACGGRRQPWCAPAQTLAKRRTAFVKVGCSLGTTHWGTLRFSSGKRRFQCVSRSVDAAGGAHEGFCRARARASRERLSIDAALPRRGRCVGATVHANAIDAAFDGRMRPDRCRHLSRHGVASAMLWYNSYYRRRNARSVATVWHPIIQSLSFEQASAVSERSVPGVDIRASLPTPRAPNSAALLPPQPRCHAFGRHSLRAVSAQCAAGRTRILSLRADWASM